MVTDAHRQKLSIQKCEELGTSDTAKWLTNIPTHTALNKIPITCFSYFADVHSQTELLEYGFSMQNDF